MAVKVKRVLVELKGSTNHSLWSEKVSNVESILAISLCPESAIGLEREAIALAPQVTESYHLLSHKVCTLGPGLKLRSPSSPSLGRYSEKT